MPPKRICFKTAKPTLEVAKARQDCVLVPKVAMAMVATRIVFRLIVIFFVKLMNFNILKYYAKY